MTTDASSYLDDEDITPHYQSQGIEDDNYHSSRQNRAVIERLEKEIELEEKHVARRFQQILLITFVVLLGLSLLASIGKVYFVGTSIYFDIGTIWILGIFFLVLSNWWLRIGIRRLEDDLDEARSEAYPRDIYLESKIQTLQERHNSAIIWLLIVMIVLFIFEFYEVFFSLALRDDIRSLVRALAPQGEELSAYIVLTLIFWGLTVLVVASIYYIRYRLPLKDARQNLANLYSDMRREKERDPKQRRDMLQAELRQMTVTIASVFLDNDKRLELANEWRAKADLILEEWGRTSNSSSSKMMPVSLGDAETLIGEINELILQEKNELQQQRRWQVYAIVIMIIYIVLPIMVILRFPQTVNTELVIPIFGIPLSVIMWGAMGSLAAILYRFYSERGRVRLDLELRWLIARPIIGIIMAGLAYLAIVSGLAILNTGSSSAASTLTPKVFPDNLEVYWVIAFLAGFSDKFYLGIINLLVGKTLGETDQTVSPKPNINFTKKTVRTTTEEWNEAEDLQKKLPVSRNTT